MRFLYLHLILFSLFQIGYSQEKPKKHEINLNKYAIYDIDLLPASFHKRNRVKLRELMGRNSVAIFFSNSVKNRSNDVDFQYHQDPNFYYLTGLKEPNSILVLFKNQVEINGEKTKEILFVQPKEESKEIWTGKRMGKLGVEMILEIETAYSNKEFNTTNFNFDQFDNVYHLPKQTDVNDNVFDKFDLHNLYLQFGSKNSFS